MAISENPRHSEIALELTFSQLSDADRRSLRTMMDYVFDDPTTNMRRFAGLGRPEIDFRLILNSDANELEATFEITDYGGIDCFAVMEYKDTDASNSSPSTFKQLSSVFTSNGTYTESVRVQGGKTYDVRIFPYNLFNNRGNYLSFPQSNFYLDYTNINTINVPERDDKDFYERIENVVTLNSSDDFAKIRWDYDKTNLPYYVEYNINRGGSQGNNVSFTPATVTQKSNWGVQANPKEARISVGNHTVYSGDLVKFRIRPQSLNGQNFGYWYYYQIAGNT